MPRKSSAAQPDVLVLHDLAQLRALSDPLRQRLLGAFADKPRTTKQAADCLGETPTKLYHHVEILAEAGLLRLVATRQKRGTTERYYAVTARRFEVDRSWLGELAPAGKTGSRSGPDAIFKNAFGAALTDLRESLEGKLFGSPASPAKAALVQGQVCATPSEAAHLLKHIQALIDNAGAKKRGHDSRAGDASSYKVLVALYPVVARPRTRRRKR